MSAENTNQTEKRPKTPEEVGKQIYKISKNLVKRAGKAGAGQYGNPINWDRGGISFDTGEKDSTGRVINQEINYSDGTYQPDGESYSLVRGAGTIDGVNHITAHENGAMGLLRTSQRYDETRSGLQQPMVGDGRPNDGNPRGFSHEELVHEAAGEAASVRNQIAQVEIASKQ